MNTRQLDAILKTDKITRKQFRGVFPSDQLPVQIHEYPSAYVANVDPSNQPGSHWVAFYFTQDQHGEFWDSYGQHPKVYNMLFVNFLERNSKQWIMNQRTLQSLDSSVCGEYCIYYLIHRCRGFYMNVVVNHFTQSKRLNDAIVFEFVTLHYPMIDRNKKAVSHQISIPRKNMIRFPK